MPDPTFVMLPDEVDTVPLAEGAGLSAAHQSLLRMAAEAMKPAPPEAGRAPTRLSSWRGLLAFALLSDQFPEGTLTVETVAADAGPIARALLAGTAERQALICVWQTEGERAVLGTADRSWGILPAAQAPALLGLVPEAVRWLDGNAGFADPVNRLTSRQRTLLQARLDAFDAPEVKAFAEDLERRDAELTARCLSLEEGGDWQTAAAACACLTAEPAFSALTSESHSPKPRVNPLLSALGLADPLPGLPPETEWRWQGKPFARSSTRTGVELDRSDPDETGAILASFDDELALLGRWSPRFMREASERLDSWVNAHAEWLVPEAQNALRQVCSGFAQLAAQPREEPAFTLPLDPSSPALRLILRDALGEQAEALALHVFSDRLARVPDGILGDVVLEDCCLTGSGTQEMMSLPPFSERVAEQAARNGWAASPVDPSSLAMCRHEDGSIEATVRLRGAGTLTLTRRYAPEEQVILERPPCVSLWPSVPMPSPAWKHYRVSVLGACTLRLLEKDTWHTVECGGDAPHMELTDTYPAAMSLLQDGLSLGTLISLDEAPPVTAPQEISSAVDFGASGLRMALTIDGRTEAFSLPSLWRILLRRGTDPGADILPQDGFGEFLSPCVRLRGDAQDPQPFTDGSISDAPDDAAAIGDLIWQNSGRGAKARRLMIREALLLLSARVAMTGSDVFRCRAVLPDRMTDIQQQNLSGEFAALAAEIGRATGIRVEASDPAVTAAAALYAFQRISTPDRPFAALDLGAGAAGLALWLRGQDRPVMALSVGSGITGFLAAVFARRPDWLRNELYVAPGREPDAMGKRFLRAADAAEHTADTVGAGEVLRRTLDSLLGPHFAETSAAIAASCARRGQLSRIHALLLFAFACDLTTAGLALEKIRWDGALSLRLPPELPLVLCGRASSLIMAFDSAQQWQLSGFARLCMTDGHPVRSLPIVFSERPGMEAVFGAAPIVSLPDPPSLAHLNGVLPPMRIAAGFLLAFRQAFPQAAELLFPGLFSVDGSLSPAADPLLTSLSQRAGGSESAAFIELLEDLVFEFARK